MPLILTKREYERLINPDRKQKRSRRKREKSEPVKCPVCEELITNEDSVSNPVIDGHATPYHLRCYVGKKERNESWTSDEI